MPTALSAPLISLGQTNYRRLEALAKQAGRTPQAMIPFVLHEGFDYCEHVVRETARGLADAKAGRLIPHDQAMAALARRVQKHGGRVKKAA